MIAREIDGFQISEVVPMDDGSLVTTLLDRDGYEVGTVRRLTDGTTQASVQNVEETPHGFDWSNVLGKVTSFLDDVAKAARETSDQAARLSHGIQGAATGAQAGYNAPLNWKPWAIAGVAVAIAIAASSSSSRRR